MVTVRVGDLFQSKAQTLVNTVNCVGVMGKGIALAFKQRFPRMFEDYVVRCRRGEVQLGRPYLYKQLVPPWILNFPTKDHWRSVTRLEDIIRGVEHVLRHYKEWGIISLAVPPLGCGQGQLEWRIVGPTLHRLLNRMEVPVELYAPHGTPHEELKPEFLEQMSGTKDSQEEMPEPHWIQAGWVALVDILRRIEEQPYHWPVDRTTFQKIAYVATEEGLPTGLNFRAGSFGPYSKDLKRLTTLLVNNGLIREEQMGRMFAVKIGRTFPDARKAYLRELDRWDAVLDRVSDLFLRMSTNEAEITATVLFAGRSLGRTKGEQPAEKEVVDAVMEWKQRRRPPLDVQTVAYTTRSLAALGWLRVTASPELPIPAEELAGV